MTFTVYADKATEVKRMLDRLAKKAEGYGIPFSYVAGREEPATVRVLGIDPATGTQIVVNRYTVAAVSIEVECDGLIRANGWTVRAKVEDGGHGNIVTGFGDYKVPQEWYTVAPHCDHCGVNRFRNVTYFVEHEDGSIRQVGRTCLKEYTGISPATAAMWAEVQDICDRGLDCSVDEWAKCRPARMYSVLSILAYACDEIEKYGYRSANSQGCTRDKVCNLIHGEGKAPSKRGLKKAQLVVDWLKDLDRSNASDLEQNCIPLALSGYAKMSHVGRLAYMPVAYDKYLEYKAKQAERESRPSQAARSRHVGEVGQRITIKAVSVTLLSSWEGQWGMTWLYKFLDESGNVFIWYASRPISGEVSGSITIKATVKNHGERDGVKQTFVTRCSVVA